MDAKMELKPNIICEQYDSKDNNMIKKNFVLNDRITSDFIIKLNIPKEIESEGCVEKFFYVHSTVFGFRSDYFQALFNSNMLESQIKFSNLTIFLILLLKNYFYLFILMILIMLTILKIGLIYYILPLDF